MRKSIYRIMALCLCMSCGGKEPADPCTAAQAALTEAVTSLSNHNYEEYMNALDFGCELDSVQRMVFLNATMQHQDWQEQTHGKLHSVQAIQADLHSDTICTVYYELCFADSVHEVVAQKMICNDGKWQLRVRD